jgi:hypothetical protein
MVVGDRLFCCLTLFVWPFEIVSLAVGDRLDGRFVIVCMAIRYRLYGRWSLIVCMAVGA